MREYLLAVIGALMIALLLGMARVILGPAPADRMLSGQLFGTTGTAMLLVAAVAMDRPALVDVALVLAVLAPITVVAFVHLAGRWQ